MKFIAKKICDISLSNFRKNKVQWFINLYQIDYDFFLNCFLKNIIYDYYIKFLYTKLNNKIKIIIIINSI